MQSDTPIVLFTPYFAATTPERQFELDECLRRNVECDEIQRIYLLVDDGHHPPLNDDKLEIVPVPGRPTYQQWVELSETKGGARISVLANSDIYFDETLASIREIFRVPRAFVALSRHESRAGTIAAHPNPHWSQDAWALHLTFGIADTLRRSLDIPLGVPRCDNKVAYCFAIHGWNVFNPLPFIRAIHVHETQQRSYQKKGDMTVLGGVAYVHPSKTLLEPAQVEIDVWAQNTNAIRAVKLNRSFDLWTAENDEVSNAAIGRGPDWVQGEVPGRTDDKDTRPNQAQTRGSAWERYDFVTHGQIVFDYLHRFCVYRHRDQLLCIDWLQPIEARKFSVNASRSEANRLQSLPTDLLAHFIPPVLDTRPIIVRERPQHPEDCHFWQYPCITEKQAYDNHLIIQTGHNIDSRRRIIHTYLGLPWATYIDKKRFPEEVRIFLRPRLRGYKALASTHGYQLAVHTVCQQIHWRRLVDQIHDIGITDLHLSHCEKGIDSTIEGYGFHVHSWPLYAVNFEDPARSIGLRAGKPIAEKRYLASFIGAQMPHYRNDIRVRLVDAAKADGADDLLVELTGEWHFNRIVYGEQVANKPLLQTEIQKEDAATLRYNQTLSDSIFSLCPEGAGPNTLRIWESLAVGAIPVIISEQWVPPRMMGSGPDLEDCCIFARAAELDELFPRLRAIERKTIKTMQGACMGAYQKIRRLRTYFFD